MIIECPVIIFYPNWDTIVSNMEIRVNCDIPEEIKEKIKVKYCTVISEEGDYRLLLLDAMKIKAAVVVQNILDASWEICYNISNELDEYPFSYIKVKIAELDEREITKGK